MRNQRRFFPIERDAEGGRRISNSLVDEVVAQFHALPGNKVLATIIGGLSLHPILRYFGWFQNTVVYQNSFTGTNNIRREPKNLGKLKNDFQKLVNEFLTIPNSHLVLVGMIPSPCTDASSKETFAEASSFLKVVFTFLSIKLKNQAIIF